MKRKLYVDMDGVIAEYKVGTPFEEINKEGYFLSLKKIGNLTDALLELINEGYDVYILSALLDNKHIEEEKNKWLDKYFPIKKENRIFTKVNVGKSIYCENKDVLLDDYNKNLFAWQKKGGIAIKCLNNINNPKSFNGSCINIYDTKENLVNILKSFL